MREAAINDRHLRVCLVCFAGYPDQGATYFFEMARSLAALSHEVTAVAVRRDGESLESLEDGVRILRMPVSLTVSWASPRRWFAKVLFLMRVAKFIRDAKFDVIHVYCTIGSFLLPLLSGRCRARWVQEHQTGAVSSRSRAARVIQDKVRAWQGKLFDIDFTVTQVLGERLFGRNGRFEVVPAGVNLHLFAPGLPADFRTQLSIPESAIVFVHAGVLEAERHTDVPLRAFARALARDDRLWLLMPGKGPQLDQLRAIAKRLGIAARVWLPGYVPYAEIPRVFASSNAGLSYLPKVAYYEGQPPMKVMEYMASGLAVIASDVSSHRGIIRHDVNGLLAEPNEVSYSDALLRFASNLALRTSLATAARESVAHLTYDRIAQERVVPIYRRLLEA